MVGREAGSLADLPEWVSAEGPAGDVALSTRARMARNVAGVRFPNYARVEDLRHVSDMALSAVRECGEGFGRLSSVQTSQLTDMQRLALVDFRLASSQHVKAGGHRWIVLNDAGTLSLMVNEEDHLRVQCILPGLQPMAALQAVDEFDRYLGRKLRYARADNYGYLTASLSNLGTGFRLSAMLHLGGLAFLEEAFGALSAAVQLRISVRGLLGEGTKALGDVFQVSNETTIGFTEREIGHRVRASAEHLVQREREARDRLAKDRRDDLSEAVKRSWKRLMDAAALSGREAMRHLSMLRLSGAVGMEPGIGPIDFSFLLASMRLDPEDRGGMEADVRRAELIKEHLRRKCRINK